MTTSVTNHTSQEAADEHWGLTLDEAQESVAEKFAALERKMAAMSLKMAAMEKEREDKKNEKVVEVKKKIKQCFHNKFGCHKQECTFGHTWCRYGARCNNGDCSYIHPRNEPCTRKGCEKDSRCPFVHGEGECEKTPITASRRNRSRSRPRKNENPTRERSVSRGRRNRSKTPPAKGKPDAKGPHPCLLDIE